MIRLVTAILRIWTACSVVLNFTLNQLHSPFPAILPYRPVFFFPTGTVGLDRQTGHQRSAHDESPLPRVYRHAVPPLTTAGQQQLRTHTHEQRAHGYGGASPCSPPLTLPPPASSQQRQQQ